MYGNPQRRTNSDVQEMRREGGRWLRELREKAGLSQRELALLVHTDYYTFVSQLENGRGQSLLIDITLGRKRCVSSRANSLRC